MTESYKKSTIYTKKGDKGLTSDLCGKRIGKDSTSIKVVGTIDELNSHLGLMEILEINSDDERINKCKDQIYKIQTHMFELGANISNPEYAFKSDYVYMLEQWIDKMDSELQPLKNFIYPRSKIQLARSVCRRTERNLVKFNNYVKFLDDEHDKDLKNIEDDIKKYEIYLENENNTFWFFRQTSIIKDKIDQLLIEKIQIVDSYQKEDFYYPGDLNEQIKYINRLSDYLFVLDRYYTHLAKVEEELKFKSK